MRITGIINFNFISVERKDLVALDHLEGFEPAVACFCLIYYLLRLSSKPLTGVDGVLLYRLDKLLILLFLILWGNRCDCHHEETTT